jgi:general secretion pathway protein G
VRSFVDALDAYRVDMGRYPTTQEGLSALVDRSSDLRWRGPYLRKAIPLDPWGRPYVYRSPGQSGAEYDLRSYGKDGAPGGSGADADIQP